MSALRFAFAAVKVVALVVFVPIAIAWKIMKAVKL